MVCLLKAWKRLNKKAMAQKQGGCQKPARGSIKQKACRGYIGPWNQEKNVSEKNVKRGGTKKSKLSLKCL